jgi:Flp pilus assembly protein TadG
MVERSCWRFARRRGEGGAAAVEFALVAPLLFMLLFGMIFGGIAFFQKISMVDAVREGARFGATADTATTSPNWHDAVRQRTVDASAGELTMANVCVEGPSGGSCGPGPSSPPSLSPGTCFVRVRAEKVVQWPDGLVPLELTIVQDSYARYERAC